MRRPGVAVGAVVVAAALAVAYLLVVRQPPRAGAGDVKVPAPSASPGPTLRGLDAPARPAPTPGGLRLTLLDVGTQLPATGLQVEIKGVGGSEEWQPRRSSEAGHIDLDAEGSVELRSADTGWRLLTVEAPTAAGSAGRRSARAWFARVLRVRARVELEGPAQPSDALRFQLTSACVRRRPGAMDASADEPGSHAWLARHAPADLFLQAGARKSPIEYLQLALPEVVVIVGGAGYAPATRVIDFSAIQGSEAEVSFQLRSVDSARVRVTDPDGKALEKAHVQLIEDRVGSPRDVNIYVETALRMNRGQACTLSYSDETARVSHITGAETSAVGTASLPSSGPAVRRYLVVWAPGHLPYLGRETGDLFEGERSIVLHPVPPLRASYRFADDGVPIQGGLLNLAEPLDGLTPALPTIPAREDGSFPAGLIVPGKEYYAVVLPRSGGRTYAGWIEFGADEVIDTKSLRAERVQPPR